MFCTSLAMKKATLVLENDDTHEGYSFGAELSVPGEVGKHLSSKIALSSIWKVNTLLDYIFGQI